MRNSKPLFGTLIFKLFLTALITFLPYSFASGENLVIASSPWPPFADKSLPEWGFTTEIIKEAFKASGNEATFIITDWMKCLEMGATGQVDALYNIYMTLERTRQFAYSEPYLISQHVFVVRVGSGITYSEIEDLKPYTICVMSGYINSKKFDEADYLTKIEVPVDIEALKKLLDREVDIVVMDKFVAIYILKNNPLLEAGLESIEFLDPPLRNATIHLGFAKVKDNYIKHLTDFNRGLDIIKQSGLYHEILKKHGYNIVDIYEDDY